MKHEHKEVKDCEHKKIEYCKKCDVVECLDCGKEWEKKEKNIVGWGGTYIPGEKNWCGLCMNWYSGTIHICSGSKVNFYCND